MKFCPNCEVKLKKGDSGLQCPKCDYVEGNETISTKTVIEEHESQFNVLSENETVETLPTIKIECEKCGNDEAVWWMLQTRSADEPTTQFYRCSKCRYTWRNYA
ncbi:MAG: transcription factor S [Nitrosopumilales archaeon CG15_BIG_FIL_POST_REV_8_21_14_020_33_23]|jgi:DNA-directed RNA polymerase subunit M|nr:MAG: transcription factor S [Nitrosopumilales archaeon CG11_big_fil_rev_8_21_14_0_20_33_24]PIW36032.1 MAG: transcription factor S [Nitrosopumilales archaeon CG15_BIG_FIL_POST_REV_8_21_14_020_33_23]PIY90434.1 MAG: transcription factor S [Nitrosopumilales archaeon CG_4_10_14_0_8_um_filter_34_8]PJB98399.1 MAG: transcription factor S [Nitrosopumilales archaeon CG_4_9_14_0_8_um_filter_34_10]